MSFYNVVFTILPPLVIGIFDQFVSARSLDRYPQLYQLGQDNYYFTPSRFFLWVGNAIYHSVVSDSSKRILTHSSSLHSRALSSGQTLLREMARTVDYGFGVPRSISLFWSLSSARRRSSPTCGQSTPSLPFQVPSHSR